MLIEGHNDVRRRVVCVEPSQHTGTKGQWKTGRWKLLYKREVKCDGVYRVRCNVGTDVGG